MGKKKIKSNKSGKSNQPSKRTAMVNTLSHLVTYLCMPICNLDSMYNKLQGVLSIPHDIQMLCDYIFYEMSENLPIDGGVPNNSDITSDVAHTLNKIHHSYAKLHVDKIMSAFKTVNLNFEEYYSFKFQLDSILSSRSIDSSFFETSEETDIFISILYRITVIIDVFFTNSFKWKVTGVDIANNRLKYITAETYWDGAMGCYRYTSDKSDYDRCFNYVIKAFSEEFKGEITQDTFVMLMDKVDDSFRLFQDKTILVDIANQKRTKFLFQPPSKELLLKTVSSKVKVSAIRTSCFARRNCLSAREGNLVITHDREFPFESFLVKDIDIGGEPFIVLGYKTKDNIEDTLIIPIKFDSILQTPYLIVLFMALEFYGVDTYSTDDSKFLYNRCEVISPYYWKYRYNKYTSTGDKVSKSGNKIREYKEVIIGIHKAKLGNPSPSALALAKEKCIVLNEGETLVREHVRHYNKQAKLEEI